MGLKEDVLSTIKDKPSISTGELCEKFKNEDELEIVLALRELAEEGSIERVQNRQRRVRK